MDGLEFALLGTMGIFMFGILAVLVVMYVFTCLGLQKVFQVHYGIEEKWKAWVPIVNTYFMCEKTFGNGWICLV